LNLAGAAFMPTVSLGGPVETHPWWTVPIGMFMQMFLIFYTYLGGTFLLTIVGAMSFLFLILSRNRPSRWLIVSGLIPWFIVVTFQIAFIVAVWSHN
jgi:hypothetical protein